jgi:hypothetical protein
LVAAAGDRAWERRTDAVVARRRRRRTDAVEDRDRRWWDVRRRRRAEVEEERRRRRRGGRLELIFRTEYLTNISTDSHVELPEHQVKLLAELWRILYKIWFYI